MKTAYQTKDRAADEVSALRRQLDALIREVRCTIADPVRPQGLKDALAQSQMLLR